MRHHTSLIVRILLLVSLQCLAGALSQPATNTWAVEVSGGPAAADKLARKLGLRNRGQVGQLKNIYEFVFVEESASHEPGVNRREFPRSALSKILKFQSYVGLVERQVMRKRVKKSYSPPTDPQWDNQWSLLNTGQFGPPPGLHLNVEPVWIQGITGCDSVVAIVDDGVDYTHPDLSSNYDPGLDYDYIDSDEDPFPISFDDNHGTNVAGVIAMGKDNGFCGVGVAYQSSITGIRLVESGMTDLQEAAALSHGSDIIEIYSNSWGPSDSGQSVDGPGPLVQLAFETGARDGRDGKGSIWVWSAGNGGRNFDSCAADGYASSIYTIGIGAATSNGSQAVYDESCAGKMAVVFVENSDPGSPDIITTDLSGECGSALGETSVATPLVAGVIALVLEVNRNLTWRDVQYLIAYTSNRESLTGGDWATNGAGLRVSHKFGFGAIDAEAMVTRARHWISVPEQQENIFMLSTTGTAQLMNPLGINFTYDESGIRYLEHVIVTATLTPSSAGRRGDIQLQLLSPSRTLSTLLPYRSLDTESEMYLNWPFMSVHFWGEDPNGEWMISVTYRGDTGFVTISDLTLTFYGTAEVPQAVQRMPADCDAACAGSCADAGADFCDRCANLRIAETLECVDQCPEGFTARSAYCYNASLPEPQCSGNIKASCVAAGYNSCCTNGDCFGSTPTCRCDESCYARQDCCEDVADVCTPDHLPFLELGTTDGVDFIPLEVFDDASSDPIDIPVTLPFGNTVQSSVHVGSNGYFSFEEFLGCCPTLFPRDSDSRLLVAPFWVDTNIANDDEVGTVGYEVHNDQSGSFLSQVSEFVSRQQRTSFDGQWMVVAEWRDVPAFGGSTSVTNTFQALLITDGTESYAVFTYRCGFLQWPGGATIGYNTDGNYYQNHPFSGRRDVNSVACLNSAATEWTNVVYHLTRRELPFLILEPTGTVPQRNDDHSDAINITEDFVFGNSIQDVVYVNTNGYFSFEIAVDDASPTLFPEEHTFLVAPYWANTNISNSMGEIPYEVFSSSDSVLSQVNWLISGREEVAFEGRWALIAEWRRVPEFGNSGASTNTFQGILVTDGLQSYAIFTYQCGSMQWSGDPATIGFIADGGFFQNHPLSGTLNSRDIACQNFPGTVWNNVVYRLVPVPASCVAAGYTSCCTNGDCFGSMPTSCRCDESCYARQDCCEDVADVCTPDHLPFLELGTTDGVDFIPLEVFDDASSDPIDIPVTLPFGNTVQSSVHVGSNGYFSFEEFLGCCPTLFPRDSDSRLLVAPFWVDTNIANDDEVGTVGYEVHNDQSGSFLSQVSEFVSRQQRTSFDGQWMVVAEWRDVPAFGGSTSVTNTFQALLITDGTESYAVFTYRCGFLQWPGGATIGYNTDGNYYQNHPFSGRRDVNSVACLNSAATEWTNVVYHLTRRELPFLILEPTGTVPQRNDDHSDAINITEDFVFGNSIQDVVYVNTNGYFSFEIAVDDASPTLFPEEHTFLVAPYWANTNISNSTGEIPYEVFSSSDSVLSQVNWLISGREEVAFEGRWALIAEWRRVPEFGNSGASTNTFQGILVTDGLQSYAIFTYQCGSMQWSGDPATIGFIADGGFFQNHPLSGTLNSRDIACQNFPGTVWNNVVYRLVPVPASCVAAGYTSCCTNGDCFGSMPTSCRCDESCYARQDCCEDVADVCTPDHLPFLELGTTDGVDFIPLEVFDDASSDPIDIPVTLPFGNTVQSSVHVGSNGYFSFEEFFGCCPTLFPGDSDSRLLVAPFWVDINIANDDEVGTVGYEVHNDQSGSFLSQVSEFVSRQQRTSFDGQWMVVAEWRDVPAFGGSTSVTNTFQALLITDGTESYVVFTYRCGFLQWPGGATIGYNTDGNYYQNHPFSGRRDVNSVACLNSAATEWTNVVYHLTRRELPFLILEPTGTVPQRNDDHSDAISITEDFVFGNSIQDVVYVNTNGYFSFEIAVDDASPTLFPEEHTFLVAPYWANTNISNSTGEIPYEVFSSSDSVLSQVNWLISGREEVAFEGRWALIAEWRRVPEFGNSGALTNTFQGILVTDGLQSYAIFTYQCGSMQWSGEATIGFIADSAFYRNHILSGTSNSNDIACQNSPGSVWSNVIYALFPDEEVSPSPSSVVSSTSATTSNAVSPTSAILNESPTTTIVSELATTMSPTSSPPPFLAESVLRNSLRVALPGFTRDTFTAEVQEDFKDTTAAAVTGYCIDDPGECTTEQIPRRKRTTVQVTADDIVITNITNNAEGQVEFILFIVLSGGSQVLGVPALESAIQDNMDAYTDAGFEGLTLALAVQPTTSTPPSTASTGVLTAGDIAGIVVGVLAAITFVLILVGFFVCWKRSQRKREKYAVSATGPQDWSQEPVVLENPHVHIQMGYHETIVSSGNGGTHAFQNVYTIQNSNAQNEPLNGVTDTHPNGSSTTKI